MTMSPRVLAWATLGLLTLSSPAAWAAGVAPPPPPPAGCSTAGLGAPDIKLIDGKFVFVRKLATILDGAIDDFGLSAAGDALSVYCVTSKQNAPRGSIAMCLTGETCPWRTP